MSDLYKAEAKRLAAHLADRHGIKLKHASILEAVAALHGAKDWNTLLGSSTAASALAVATTRGLPTDGLLGDNLGRTSRGTPLYLSDEDLIQHTLVVGKFAVDYLPPIERLVTQHIERGGSLLYIGQARDEDLEFRLQKVARKTNARLQVFHRDDYSSISPELGYDFCRDFDHEFTTRRLLDMLPDATSSDARQDAAATLEVLLAVHKAQGVPFNVERVMQLIEKPESLKEVAAQLQVDGYRLDTLRATLLNGRTLSRLTALLRVHPERSGRKGSLDLTDLLCNGGLAYATSGMMGKQDASECMGRMLLTDLEEAVNARLRTGFDRTKPPVMVVVESYSFYRHLRLDSHLAPRARGANVGLVLHVESAEQLGRIHGERFEAVVLGNTYTKVLCPKNLDALRGLRPDLPAHEVARLKGLRAALLLQGSAIHPVAVLE